MLHSTQMYIPLKPPFSRHKGVGVQFTDEPTGNLDEEIADEIIKILMKSAHEMGKSVIVVTHSKKIADAADVVLKIHEGKLYHLV